MHDIAFEAAFLRLGLLVGLCHERDVPGWAEPIIVHAPREWTARLADVIASKVELSAMREALRPLGESVDTSRVVVAVLTSIAGEQAVRARVAADVLRMLGQMRGECRLPPVIASRIKFFEDRVMLARAGVRGQVAPDQADVTAFLDEVREAGFFRFSVDAAELPAFVAALSRKVARDRTWGDRPGHVPAQAWLLPDEARDRHCVILNETAWLIAAREFGPVPLGSRIPYPAPGALAVPVIDEATAMPLGFDQARNLTHTSEPR